MFHDAPGNNEHLAIRENVIDKILAITPRSAT
jgi:hypothetical protein